MADEEDNNTSGKIAGGIAGTAVGVALISNPTSVLGMLGVSAAAPAASGGLMTVATAAAAPAAAISGGAILALGIVAVACVALGVMAGGALMKAFSSEHKNSAVSPSQNAVSPAPVREQEIADGKNWAKTVETERAAMPQTKSI